MRSASSPSIAPTGHRRRRAVLAVVGVAVAAAGAVLATLLVSGGASGGAPFGWFTAQAAPAGWRHLALPDGAVLFAPRWTSPVDADPGAVSAQRREPGGGYLVYLNATPWTGASPPEAWARARADRLADENTAVHVDGSRDHLRFAGGAGGSCVTDHYVTRVGRHRFTEMACLVRSRSGTAAVVVAAASSSLWGQAQPELRRALEAFRA